MTKEEMRRTEKIIDEAWVPLAKILDRKDLEGWQTHSVICTILARYLNCVKKFATEEQMEMVRNEFMGIINEKLMKHYDA